MRTIKVLKNNHHMEYRKDILLIQDALIDRGFFATEEQCVELWEMYSETLCAGWLSIDGCSKQQIFDLVKPFFEAGPEGSLDTKYI